VAGWHPHPDVWLLLGIPLVGYFLALRRLGPRFTGPGEPAATRRQKTAFVLGVATLWVASDWPIHELAEHSMYWVHMVQHLLQALVAPPLLLVGTPAWMARAILRPRVVLRLARTMSRPIPALLAFNAVIALIHWPEVVNLMVRSELAHLGFHTLIVGSALLMWMPVFSPLLEIPRLPYPLQMLYLFLQSLLPTVPASFMTFADSPLFDAYVNLPRPWGMSAVTDQMIAGLIMKIVGGLILWTVIAYLFFTWYRQEESEGSDALQWRGVERELDRLETRR
jgi:putative membrane protein